MSEHRVSVRWERGGVDFSYETYPRDHVWSFAGGVVVPASGAPEFLGNPERVDPEAAFVAALSSCHMLTFLAIASRRRLVVDSYEDAAVGILEKNGAGRLAVTRVTLRPKIQFGGPEAPSKEELSKLQEQAHRECFIANSVLTAITIE